MRIRNYEKTDFEQLKSIHLANGYAFELPNVDHPLVLVKKVLADEQNTTRMVAIGRLHINAMLFVDGHWATPQERFTGIISLQDAMMCDASEKGLDIATTQADGRFAERLTQMGWIRGFQDMFYRQIQ